MTLMLQLGLTCISLPGDSVTSHLFLSARHMGVPDGVGIKGEGVPGLRIWVKTLAAVKKVLMSSVNGAGYCDLSSYSIGEHVPAMRTTSEPRT